MYELLKRLLNIILVWLYFRMLTKDCPSSTMCSKPYVMVTVVTVVKAEDLKPVKEGVGKA